MFPSLAYLILQAIAGLLTDAIAPVSRCQSPAGNLLCQTRIDNARRANAVTWFGIKIGIPVADLPPGRLMLRESPWLGLFLVFGVFRMAIICCFLSGDDRWAAARLGIAKGMDGSSVIAGRWEMTRCFEFFTPLRRNRRHPNR